jgi:hypothetical protein
MCFFKEPTPLQTFKVAHSLPAGLQLLYLLALQAQATLDPSYQAAMQRLINFFTTQVIGKCQFSLEGMLYAGNDATLPVSSSGVFFPAASWLRAFFHDAGTFVKSASEGGPKGETDHDCAVLHLGPWQLQLLCVWPAGSGASPLSSQQKPWLCCVSLWLSSLSFHVPP